MGAAVPQCDVVVKGTVQSAGAPTQGRIAVRVTIDYVLRGGLDGRECVFTYTAPARTEGTVVMLPKLQEPRPGLCAIFLLARRGDALEPFDPQHMFLPVRPARVRAPDESPDPLSLVREELLWALTGEDAAIKPAAARQLGTLPADPRAISALKALLASEDRALRGAAVAALLRLDAPSALKHVGACWAEANGTPRDFEGAMFLLDLLLGIERIRQPDAAEGLVSLLGHGDARVRRASAHALSTMDEGSIIPPLAKALWDADLEVRHSAVMGLARITGHREWAVAIGTYREKEAAYLQPCRDWWRREGQPAFEGAEGTRGEGAAR